MKNFMKKLGLIALVFALGFGASVPAQAAYNFGNTDLIPLLQYIFNTSATFGGTLTVTGATTLSGIVTNAGVINADGGIDRSTAAGLAIGATNATSVTITPATTVTGVLSANGGIDRSTAAALAIGATNATSVVVTPATTFSSTVGATVITASTNFAGSFKSGTGSGTYVPSGVMQVSTTSTGNGADTTEDTLVTYSLPANTLSANGKGVRVRAWGTFAANADNKTTKLYFGAAVITTPTAATNAKNWWLDLVVVRSGSSTQAVLGSGQVDTTMVTPYYNAATETDSGAIVIKATGTAGTANANDIVIKGFVVEMLS